MTHGNVFEFRPDWQNKNWAVTVQLPLVGTELVFPDSHNGKPVSEIGWLFNDNPTEAAKLTRVVIPDTVVRLHGFAFAGCVNLAEVVIPKTSKLGTIDKYAFSECKSLKTLDLPSTIVGIGDSAFWHCTSLQSFHFNERLILMGESAFYGCTSLQKITFHPDCNLPDIKMTAFFGCESLESVCFPRDLENIFDRAFAGCTSLKSVSFAENSELYSIGAEAFAGCSNLIGVSLKHCQKMFSIGRYAFCNCHKLRQAEFPANHPVKLYEEAFSKKVKKINYKSNGCYVATCVYGSYDCAPVWTLRRFRDRYLANSAAGRAFIRLYYAVSPTAVKWFGNTAWFRSLFRPLLDRLVGRLQQAGYESTPYGD